MKNFFMIIELILIYLVLNKEYDFISGISQNITNLKSGEEYYFYIKAINYQNVNIKLYINSNSNPFQLLQFYEYINRTNNYSSYNRYYRSNINYYIKCNEIEGFDYYTVLYPNTSYVAYKLLLSYDIDFLVVNIEVKGETYNLINGELKNLTNLVSETPYYFFIDINKDQTANINLNINYMVPQPFTDLYIYEYLKDDIDFRREIKKEINTIIKNNELIGSTSYSASYDSTHLGIKIIPEYDINYFTMKINVGGGAFNLKNDVLNNITNLTSLNTYYFFIKAKEFQKVTINLTMDYMSINPFDFLKIYEFQGRNTSYSFYENNYEIQNINMTIKNNEMFTSFSYLVYSFLSEYLVIQIIPSYNINYLLVGLNLGGGSFDFEGSQTKNISNVMFNNSYYLYVYANSNQTINIYLSMDYISIQPFKNININEYKYRGNRNPLKIINQSLIERRENNKLIASLSYYPSVSSTRYVAFELIPNININYLITKIDVQEKSSHSDSSNFTEIIIIIIIISCIIIVFCIILIIYCIRKSNSNKSDLEDKMDNAQPIYDQKDS